MKKTFALVTAVISFIVLMLSIGVNLAQAQNPVTIFPKEEQEVMTKSCSMVVDKGQTMHDAGMMMTKGTMDKDTMMKQGDMMMKQGDRMMKEGNVMSKQGNMLVDNGKMMMEYGKMMMEGKMDKETMMKVGDKMMKAGGKTKEAGKNGITFFTTGAAPTD